MTLSKIAVLLYCVIHAVTLGQACQYDDDCDDDKYCYEISNLCTKCENCTRYKRKEGKNLCAKDPSQCGDCLSGYYQNENQVRHDGARPKFCSKIPTTTPLTTVPPSEEYFTPAILPTSNNILHPTAVPLEIILIIAGLVSIAAVFIAVFNRKRVSNMIKLVSNRRYASVNLQPDVETNQAYQPNNLETNDAVCSFPVVNTTEDVPQKAVPLYVPNWMSPAQTLDADDEPEQPEQPQPQPVTDNPTIPEDTEAPPPYTENSNASQRQPSVNRHPTNESTNPQYNYQPNHSPEMDFVINNNNNLQSNQNLLFLNNIQMKFYLPNGYASWPTGNSASQFSSTTRLSPDKIDINELQTLDN